MTDDRLPTKLLVSAQIRQAATQNVPITVLHSGDPNSGVIILKINLMNGQATVLQQIRHDAELVWAPAGTSGAQPEIEADALLARQLRYDPDAWLLEIEDKQGRHWFPGRRLT